MSLALSLPLGACGGGLLSSGPPPTYDLTSAQFPRGMGAGRGQLVVAEPTGVAVLGADKVIVRSADGSVATLPDAQWSDRLPLLVQARLIDSFQNARRMRVGRPGDGLNADYQLVTDLRAFQISVGQQVGAEVEIAAKIVTDRSGRIVAGKIFHAFVPLPGTDPQTATAGLGQAFDEVAREIVTWTAHQV